MNSIGIKTTGIASIVCLYMQQSATRDKGCKLYPPYNSVAKAKSTCLPPAAAVTVEPVRAATTLKALLDHTAARILQLQAEVLTRIDVERIRRRPQACMQVGQ